MNFVFNRKFLILLFYFLSSLAVFSQVNSDYVTQIGLDFVPSYYFSPAFQVTGEVGVERQMNNNGWKQFIFNPYIRTWLGKRMNFYAGIGNYYTVNKYVNNRWEIRPHQSVVFSWPKFVVPIRHRIRLEERFDFNTNTWTSNNSIRGRYRIGTAYRWRTTETKYWEADLTFEFFFNLWGVEGEFQEQARISLGVDRGLKRNLVLRFELTWVKEKLFNFSEPYKDVEFKFKVYRFYGIF